MSQPLNNNNLQFWDTGAAFQYQKNMSTNDEINLRFWDTGGTIEGMYSTLTHTFMPFFWGA